MNNYFTNIATHLKLKPAKFDPKANLESIINTFQNHGSVQRIFFLVTLFRAWFFYQ